MSDEREFLECEIADAMESDEDCRLEVALIIRARSQRDEALALLAQRDGELEALREKIHEIHKPSPVRDASGEWGWCHLCDEKFPCPTIAALDRGLKGAGE